MESSFAAINSKLTSIQRVGIEYDAFDQNSCQQSFSIAMLNNKFDGCLNQPNTDQESTILQSL